MLSVLRMLNKIDLNLLKSIYNDQFIEDINILYIDTIKDLIGGHMTFFRNPGLYLSITESSQKEVLDYFKNLLFVVNIEILDYIIKNYETFKNKTFLDYGSGFCLLSIFLKKININCYNYDTFNQMNQDYITNFLITVNSKFGYDLTVTNIKEMNKEVICCSGYWLTENIKSKYLLLDCRYDDKYPKHTLENHQVIDYYHYSRIYKRTTNE